MYKTYNPSIYFQRMFAACYAEIPDFPFWHRSKEAITNGKCSHSIFDQNEFLYGIIIQNY